MHCSICQVSLHQGSATVTPCGHIFHYNCVIQWLYHNKNCPHCRQICDICDLKNIYLPSNENKVRDDVTSLQNQLETLQEKLQGNVEEKKGLESVLERKSVEINHLKHCLKSEDKKNSYKEELLTSTNYGRQNCFCSLSLRRKM